MPAIRVRSTLVAVLAVLLGHAGPISAQTNPLWHEQKIKNYLPHMTWPEVQDLLTRTDMPEDTGKHTSAREMSTTGAWSVRDPKDATAEQGRRETEAVVDAAVQFIDRWKALVPMSKR
jgi:creatinine amidohydrolase/Fe(II)-dependent formamide hydrolase-like protein